MAEDGNDDYEQLNRKQRMKAAVHYAVVQICKEVASDEDIAYNRQVLAALAETTWRQCENFASDMEMFAKHGKRSTITADDVKLLLRKSPKLLEHISNIHEQNSAGKEESKKRGRKPKKSTVTASTLEEVDEDSNM